MRLSELDPEFVKHEVDRLPKVGDLAQADGVKFDCPCGTGHAVICWFRGKVPDSAVPGPGRWDVSGSSPGDLTLSPSVSMSCWHGWIQAGEVKTC